MSTIITSKKKQAFGSFNNGEIQENKPIGFPQDGGNQKAYSNLFYWAHAHTTKGSTIGLHPHRGFEIVSYVLKGTIRHYDTKTDKWLQLDEGSFQVIQSGNGISHSEELLEDSAIFQIWFDPDLSKSLQKEAQYADYTKEVFPTTSEEGIRTKTIVGEASPVQMDSEDIIIKEMSIQESCSIQLTKDNIYSFYLIEGELELNGQLMSKDDFALIENEETLSIKAIKASKLFLIQSPKTISYKTYINS